MNIAVQVEPEVGTSREVRYTWDPDTDILSARLHPGANGEGMSGSVEIAGADGSWLIFDVAAGRINGLEVAVWPDVRKRGELAPPTTVEDAAVVVPSRRPQAGPAAMQVEIPVAAEADSAERVIHFRIGKPRQVRVARLAPDFLIEVDTQSRLAGLWLLNVPPFPEDE